MKLLTRWQTFWKPNRKEMAFHCDLILEPDDFIVIVSSDILQAPFFGEERITTIAPPPGRYAKVHLSASWEFRDTLFAKKRSGEDE